MSRTAATNVTGFANIVLPSCIGSRDPMLRNDVSKFRVLMCIILGLVSNEDNRLVYQWRGIRRIEFKSMKYIKDIF